MEAIGNEQVGTGSGGESAPIGDQGTFRRQGIEHLVDQLKEPFDPRVVQWVVTATAERQGRASPRPSVGLRGPTRIHGPVK